MSRSYIYLHKEDNEGVRFERAYSALLDSGRESHYLDLRVGSSTVSIFFNSFEEISSFCEKHNIGLKDERNV